MKRTGLLLMGVLMLLAGAWWAQAIARGPLPSAATAPAARLELPAAAGMRFVPVDIVLDTGSRALGSYQLEITAAHAAFVGLEGGDPAPFKKAPYYDPAALQPPDAGRARIVIAAFSTEAQLPTGASRIARLHLSLAGDEKPELTSKLVVATDGAGRTIEAKLQLVPQGEVK
jgi:hypothetical protein